MKTQVTGTGLWQGWLGRFIQPGPRKAHAEERVMRQEMEAARREMEAAEQYFQNVTDPELVDHAIFSMEAARRKYLFLYRRLRRSQGGTVETSQEDASWT